MIALLLFAKAAFAMDLDPPGATPPIPPLLRAQTVQTETWRPRVMSETLRVIDGRSYSVYTTEVRQINETERLYVTIVWDHSLEGQSTALLHVRFNAGLFAIAFEMQAEALDWLDQNYNNQGLTPITEESVPTHPPSLSVSPSYSEPVTPTEHNHPHAHFLFSPRIIRNEPVVQGVNTTSEAGEFFMIQNQERRQRLNQLRESLIGRSLQ